MDGFYDWQIKCCAVQAVPESGMTWHQKCGEWLTNNKIRDHKRRCKGLSVLLPAESLEQVWFCTE